MKVWVYCILRNEAALLPYFLRHYSTFADRITFYDDHSDDGSRQIIEAWPKTVLRDWNGEHGIVDDEFLACANQEWKEAIGHADWVAWVDIDEFLYHPSILEVMNRYMDEGVDIPTIAGYGMVSNAFPTTSGQIYDEIKTGFRSPEWDKCELFRTTVNMVWNVGRHSLNRERMGRLNMSERFDIKLLHYRYLGADYVRQRNQRNHERQPERCKRLSYGDNVRPDANKTYSTKWFMDFKNQPFPNVI